MAAANDYEIVVAGVASMLAAFDELEVVDQIIVGDPVRVQVDVALYDTYGRTGIAGPALQELVSSPKIERVAVFSLDLHPELVRQGRAAGACGFISKALPALDIKDAILAVAAGELVMASSPRPRPASQDLNWPAKDEGLSVRQSQVLVLAAEGLTNREIGEALFLSPETVKSYLGQTLRKLGLRNRVEASAYVHRHATFARFQPAEAAMEGEVVEPIEEPGTSRP